jgi:LPXTG-motif cell wall-anchored protein
MMPGRKVLLPLVFAGLLITISAPEATAQTPLDKPVYFTFSQPVSLPGVTLQPGRYLFRLADSQVQRNIIMVYSGDGQKYFGTFMTIPNAIAPQNGTPPSQPLIRFMETAAGSPNPVRSYYYPGERLGYEFVYPRQQAMNLAKASKEPVLTTKSNAADPSKAGSNDLARVDASGQDVAVNAEASNAAADGRTQNGEVGSTMPTLAQAGANAQTSAAEARNNASTAMNQADRTATADTSRQANAAASTRTRLPQTASATPLVALLGLLSLMAGVGLALQRRLS